MTKKKTATTESPFNRKPKVKVPEPKFRYNIGQKLFVITYHKGQPENIWEVKVTSRSRREIIRHSVPATKETMTFISYHCLTPDGGAQSYDESFPFPSFQQAAVKFAESFLVERPA